MKSKLSIFTSIILLSVLNVSGQTVYENGRNSENNQNTNIQIVPSITPVIITPTPLYSSDLPVNDNVIADDQIITGSLGVGFDCVDGESFGFNTILLKENNLRIRFEDTSNPPFPGIDWTLIANDANSGGANYFAIEFTDTTSSVIPFKVMAGAPVDAINIYSNGNIGFRTATPSLSLHAAKGDTPGLRLEQNNTSGWTPQTWDLAGNEANFFIRDVTNGSKLPFRIQTNAPTNSLTILDTGNVGIGTWSPTQRLEVNGGIKLAAILNAPGLPTEGTIFMDGTNHLLKYHNGTQWNEVTDDQNLTSATLTGNILQIYIENGTSVSVDLQPLIAGLEARIVALEAAVGIKESKVDKISFSQNTPNPFTLETNISFFIPNNINNASLVIYNVKGSKVKEIQIDKRGNGNLVITKNDIETGSYFYTFILDGKKMESKIMIKVE